MAKVDSQRMFEQVCALISDSPETIKDACEKVGMNYNTFYAYSQMEQNLQLFARAREAHSFVLLSAMQQEAEKTIEFTKKLVGVQDANANAIVSASNKKLDIMKYTAGVLNKSLRDGIDVTSGGDKLNTLPAWFSEDLKNE